MVYFVVHTRCLLDSPGEVVAIPRKHKEDQMKNSYICENSMS